MSRAAPRQALPRQALASLPRLPLALCGTLLVAAACVLFPRWAEPVLGPARWLMCLPLRALPGSVVEAADGALATERTAAVRTALARLSAAATNDAQPMLDAGLVPVICRVLERRLLGAASLPTMLVLDRSWATVRDCTGVVTRGGALVGFLASQDDAVAQQAHGHAVVRCVHAAPRGEAPRRFIASVSLDDLVSPPASALRFVVEPASRIDPWPLRVGLIEDPYRAARSGSAWHCVRTFGGAVAGIEVLRDLELGNLRVWGYQEEGGATLAVGYFVEPAFDPRAIVTVALWRRAHAPMPAMPETQSVAMARAVRGARLPQGRRLYLVTGALPVAVGAAVVARDGSLVGEVDEVGPGDAVASRFGVVGRTWSLLVVPDDAAQAPRECSAKVAGVVGHQVVVQLTRALDPLEGEVLTGGQGLHCPAGLWIGRIAGIEDEGRRLRIDCPPPDLGAVAVCILPETAP